MLTAFCTTNGNSWGKFPCVSTKYDWRNAPMVAESQRPQMLYERLCGLASPYDGYARATMQLLLPSDVTCTATSFSSRGRKPAIRSSVTL